METNPNVVLQVIVLADVSCRQDGTHLHSTIRGAMEIPVSSEHACMAECFSWMNR